MKLLKAKILCLGVYDDDNDGVLMTVKHCTVGRPKLTAPPVDPY